MNRTASTSSSLLLAGLLALGCASPNPAEKRSTGDGELAENSAGLTTAQANLARWGSVITLPLVPASGANLPDGKILLWSAEDRFGFGVDLGRTYSLIFDPVTLGSTERLVTETGHDMFCPGTAMLPDGSVFVNGGLSTGATSIYHPSTATWSTEAVMSITRAYQGSVPLYDGSVFTLGGSWAGGRGNKHGEIWTAAGGWRRPQLGIDTFISKEAGDDYPMDSHLWLLPVGNGRIFHAGPGVKMHWIETTGEGRITSLGNRGDDAFAINGSAVIFDTGKVLKVGGAPSYAGVDASNAAYIMDVGAGVTVRKIAPMAYQRSFHNSVVLPNGQVVLIGGQTFAQNFSDSNSVLAAELFDPITETFTALPAMTKPRNYHAIALLLPDGRVLSSGGGLCGDGCGANHPDIEILSPPYLFNADGSAATRPVIQSAPTQAAHGSLMNVTTNTPVSAFSMVRSSSNTHAVNNDQRRLSLSFSQVSPNNYTVQVPSNSGWALPGVYMLFALNSSGVPSIARTVRIGASTLLPLTPVRDQGSTLGVSISLPLSASSPSGNPLTFGATGLPNGLLLNPTTGVISGVPTSLGRSLVEVSASDGLQTISTQFAWDVYEPGLKRFVRLESRSEVSGFPFASAAEIEVLDGDGVPLPRGAWSVNADSSELAFINGVVQNAIDGDPNTIWRTQWIFVTPTPHPHWLQIDLGAGYKVSGLRYVPRTDTTDGVIANYAVFTSVDGSTWGSAAVEGNLSALGPANQPKTVYFNNVARNKVASQSSTAAGAVAGRAVDGNTDGVLASGSVTQTNSEATPWWEVDLGAQHRLFALRLWNRSDCCAAALSNFRIFTATTPMTGRTLAQLEADANVLKLSVAGAAPAAQLHTLSGSGRYVRVQLAGTGSLTLTEVEVFGRLAGNSPPTLAQPSPGTAAVGSVASLTLLGSDPDGDTLTYSASSLPPGLAINPTTGVISGTATTAGTYQVSASVSDGHSGSASVQFSWVVGVTAPPPPTVNPVVAPLAPSTGNINYTASATGTGLQYSWSFGDGTPDSAYTSSPSVSHNFTKPGVYIVILTVRNTQGESVSTQFVQAVATPAVAGRARSSSNLIEEVRTGQTPRFWSANIDNDTVSVFARSNLSKIKEIPVGSRPRSLAQAPDGRIWVANKGSSTLSVIDPVSLTVVQTVALPRASQPFGVLCGDNGMVYVALEATGNVLRLDTAGVQLQRAVGPNPRHLALSPAGDKLLVSRFITKPQPGEATAFVESSVAGVLQGAEVLSMLVSTFKVSRAIVLRHSDKPDTSLAGRGVPNYLGAPAISPDGKSAWVPSKQDNIKRGMLRDAQNLDFQNTVRAIASRIDLVTSAEDYAARVDFDNSGVASAAAYHASGAYLFVALEASRQVAVVDVAGKRELFRVDTGLAPQAVSVSADGHTLYVHNALGRSVSVYDLSALIDRGSRTLPLLGELDAVAVEKLAAQVLRGKQLFYDARDTRLARDAYLSCASCHNDGGHDGRVWDLTGLGEGLRNTISLRGHAGAQGRLHWSFNFDEVQDFEGQIRTLAQGTGLMTNAAFQFGTRSQPLGDPKAGVSADLDALAAYLVSLSSADASPFRDVAGALTSVAAKGRTLFTKACVACHGRDDYSDSAGLAVRNVGTIRASSGTRLGGPLFGLDTPSLRGSWASAPYLHDGSAATLDAAILAHQGLTLTSSERAYVAEFVNELDADEPPISITPPPGLRADYFANSLLNGPFAFTKNEAVKFKWGASGPAGLPLDSFSIRWSGRLVAPTTGNYRLQTISDDGVRLWLDGVLLVDNWTMHTKTVNSSATVALVAGQRYDLKLEYQELGADAIIQLNWQLPGTTAYVVVPVTALEPAGSGLIGEYFANSSLSGSAVLMRYEVPSFDWATGSPAPELTADNFSVRWKGSIEAPSDGSYQFKTRSADGVRLWINNALVIDNWTAHAAIDNLSPSITLRGGYRYDVKLEYQELSNAAVIQLSWLAPGASSHVAIPTSRLYDN